MISLKNQPDGQEQTRGQAVAEPSTSRVVPKPVPQAQAQDPRGYQIAQLRKRFSPTESTAADGATCLVFKLVPSDPDFPFELAQLDCDLRVPQNYPQDRPELLVRNKNIPRGFSINVERGWRSLAEERKGATLLSLMHALDKNLEQFLSEQKVETIKLVSFKDTRHIDAETAAPEPKAVEAPKPTPPSRRYIPEESYSREQITQAKARRAQEVRQLEARMGKLHMYRRSADGIVYTLPIDPKRRYELPPGLQSVRSLHLIIPLLYPLQDLRIQLNEAEASDAEPVEDLFTKKASEQKQMTLMSHMNYLSQNLHTLAKQAQAMAAKAKEEEAQVPAVQEEHAESAAAASTSTAEVKSHIQVIPRPPEWNVGGDESSSEEEDSPSDSGDDGGAVLDIPEEPAPTAVDTPERGTMMSFPSIELHGIELLQVSILNISVKCERCKTGNDMTGLKPGVEKTTSCKKCAVPFAAVFRHQLVHEHSTRAGFLDLAGCKVADMLPSTFIPTCGKCSTDATPLVSVRGETMTNVCRECHGKFTFKIPDVRFLLITPGTLPPPAMGPRRRQEKLGLRAGEPLPGKGSCPHYKKSYRWFRFSCCGRVHACDRCHDGAEDHAAEWAARMVCGWCSREQRYAPEACGFCGRSVVGRKGRGFWEGGKGTRDRAMMSRKDPRKYRRIGGSQAAATAAKKD